MQWMQKIAFGFLTLCFTFTGGFLLWAQIRVDNVITWGQIGEILLGILGFVLMVFVLKADVKNLGKFVREYVHKQDKICEEITHTLTNHGERIARLEGSSKRIR